MSHDIHAMHLDNYTALLLQTERLRAENARLTRERDEAHAKYLAAINERAKL